MATRGPTVETPKTAREVAEIVAAGRPLEIRGGGTKRAIGAVRGATCGAHLLVLVLDEEPVERVVLVGEEAVERHRGVVRRSRHGVESGADSVQFQSDVRG